MNLRKRLRRQGYVLVNKDRHERLQNSERELSHLSRTVSDNWRDACELREQLREAEAEAQVWEGIAKAAERKAACARIELRELEED